MRFVKRRGPAARNTVKSSECIIIFDSATRNWRERVKALKASQEAGQSKDDEMLSKQEPDRS
jgi:hypothetical protein